MPNEIADQAVEALEAEVQALKALNANQARIIETMQQRAQEADKARLASEEDRRRLAGECDARARGVLDQELIHFRKMHRRAQAAESQAARGRRQAAHWYRCWRKTHEALMEAHARPSTRPGLAQRMFAGFAIGVAVVLFPAMVDAPGRALRELAQQLNKDRR